MCGESSISRYKLKFTVNFTFHLLSNDSDLKVIVTLLLSEIEYLYNDMSLN